MAESIGNLYSTKIPSLSETADIQEALRLYHYGAPSGTGSGEYDPTNPNPALLVNPSIAYTLNFLQSQITSISGSLGVSSTAWTAKGVILTATAPSIIQALTVGSDGFVLTANSSTATGLQWASPSVTPTNTITLTNKTLSAPRIDLSNPFIADSNGNELIKFPLTNVTSAINEVNITNAATGNPPTISVSGDDANISLNLTPKGTGTVNVSGVPIVTTTATQTLTNKTLTAPRISSGSNIADSNGNELIRFPSVVASAVNEITVTNTATGGTPSISATGNDTNISLNLIPKGTGILQANGVAIVTISGSQTLTNKTINGSNNTISNISLTSSVTGILPVANGGTGISSFGAGIATWLGTPSSANLASAITDETGTGALVFASSPALAGTPTAPTAADGTNTTQIATTAYAYQLEDFVSMALSDEITNITTGNAKLTWRAPFAMTLTRIPRASLNTASTSGNPTVDINVNGSSILGANKLSIDVNEKTSVTAATPTTLATTSIADDDEITFDIDISGTNAKGLKVVLYYKRA